MMNTAVKSITQGSVISKATPFVLPMPNIRVLILLALILFSALGLVYVKDLSRRLFISYSKLQQVEQRLEIEHGKLMLEESVWITPARLQQAAMQNWNMKLPAPPETVLIKI